MALHDVVLELFLQFCLVLIVMLFWLVNQNMFFFLFVMGSLHFGLIFFV